MVSAEPDGVRGHTIYHMFSRGGISHARFAHLGKQDVLGRYSKIVVPEMNLGQLSKLVRAEYLVDAQPVAKVKGQPFTAGEIHDVIVGALQ